MEFPLILDRRLKLGSCSETIGYPNPTGDGSVDACGRVTSPYKILASHKLVKDLESHGIPNKVHVGKILEGPELTVSFTFKDIPFHKSIPEQGFLTIAGLERIASFLGTEKGFNLQIRLDIESLMLEVECVDVRDGSEGNFDIPFSTSSTYIFPVTENSCDPIHKSMGVDTNTESAHIFGETLWEGFDFDFGIIVSLTLLCFPIVGLDPEIPFHLAYANKLLPKEDLAIIAENGSEIKAHRNVLAAHSSVFEAMFQHNMKEARTGVLELKEMCEESVRAFLEFVYVWKRTAAEENSDICVDLLEAGHTYGILPLESCMKHILLKKPDAWFTPDSVLRLAIFMKKDVQHEELKNLAIKMLKVMQNEVETLPAFQELCKETEKNEKELLEYLATSTP